MIEWIVGCGWLSSDIEGGSGIAVGITCLSFGTQTHNLRGVLKPFLLGLLGLAERPRVSDSAMVLVQVFREISNVPFSDSLDR